MEEFSQSQAQNNLCKRVSRTTDDIDNCDIDGVVLYREK